MRWVPGICEAHRGLLPDANEDFKEAFRLWELRGDHHTTYATEGLRVKVGEVDGVHDHVENFRRNGTFGALDPGSNLASTSSSRRNSLHVRNGSKNGSGWNSEVDAEGGSGGTKKKKNFLKS